MVGFGNNHFPEWKASLLWWSRDSQIAHADISPNDPLVVKRVGLAPQREETADKTVCGADRTRDSSPNLGPLLDQI